MESFIPTQSLEFETGERRRSFWRNFLPEVSGINGRYYLPSGTYGTSKYRGQSLCPLPSETLSQYFSPRQRLGLSMYLTRDVGLSNKLASILLARPIVLFERLTSVINGLVDALWVSDHNHFVVGSEARDTVQTVCIKIFKLGTSSSHLLVQYWKQFTSVIFHTAAKTELATPISLSPKNIFGRLLQIPAIGKFLTGREFSKPEVRDLMHLISTRQMPFMGDKTVQRSREAFIKVITQRNETDIETLTKLQVAAVRIGKICRNTAPILPQNGAAHISVTSAGELSYSIRRGGHAAAVLDALKRYLVRPETGTWDEDTPFGKANHVLGKPLWMTLFRGDPDDCEKVSLHSFLEPRDGVKEQPGSFWGLDEVTGKQIMYCAWKDSSREPHLRAEFVPEMGDKARWVTCSPYWLNVIEAPLSHICVEAVKYHPYVYSSFHKQDQAWESLRNLCKADYVPRVHGVLSSDLKDATNSVRHEVATALIEGFVTGFWSEAKLSVPYIKLALSMISNRWVMFKDPTESVLATTGIFMGESLAKLVLTLLNLSIEQMAFDSYTRPRSEYAMNMDVFPWVSWRGVHIGGDDHIVIGPLAYLRSISSIHVRVGSILSEDKHGISREFVKYTERVILVRNFKNRVKFKDLDKDFDRSPLIDGVKIRLLEKGESTLLKKDEKNVAIGKSGQLLRTIEWLPQTMGNEKVWSIRNLFVKRMGNLLPKECNDPTLYAMIHLPLVLGGYGLGFQSEIRSWLKKSPKVIQRIFGRFRLMGEAGEALSLLSRLNRNPSKRGIPQLEGFTEKLRSYLVEYNRMTSSLTWGRVFDLYRHRLDDHDPRRIIDVFRSEGWVSHDEFIESITRANVFQELLLQRAPPVVFNTVKFRESFSKIWDALDSLTRGFEIPDWDNISDRQVKLWISEMSKPYYLNIKQVTSFDMGHWNPADPDSETYDFFDAEIGRGFTKTKPNLVLGFRFLGFFDHVEEEKEE